ncbi:sugar ABC transporter permease [Rathayibacter festucae]|uniref:carbohydrate ABC transporter permease n=1 Tax=Rathayibacter festucae TaxID=110937 RepID=UPI002A6B393F|nr:sugar ABC transporter permease [Rathayibacter festucae]
MFILWPIGTAVFYSTTSSSGYGDLESVGVENYVRALGDDALYAAFGRNIIFAAIVVAASGVIGFVLAYLLYLRVRGWRALQVLFMVPYILPVVVTALLWQFMLQPDTGLVNTALRAMGLPGLAGSWLTGESSSLLTVSAVQAWVMIPLAMLLIFGAMIAVPAEVLEAARLDGAGHLRIMATVMLPSVRPAVVLALGVIALQLFRSFDLVYLLTGGGPISSSTIATLYVYVQGFVNNEYGYANAAGVVVGLVLVLAVAIPRVVASRREKSEVSQ